jgi:hypothetical protein
MSTYWKYGLSFVVFLFVHNSNSAQTSFEISPKHLLFEDAISGEPILVYNDSMLVRGFDFKTHKKTKFPEDLNPLEFNSYQYKIEDVNYLVDNGCGPVFKFYDNTFTRIDHSFKHRNQYGALSFNYNNGIYLWSGYGLFAYKNILTHYDFTTKEWQQEQQQYFKNVVPRADAIHLKKGTNLYVFGGYDSHADLTIPNSQMIENYVWRLDLKTFSWYKEQKYRMHPSFIKSIFYKRTIFQIDDKIVIVSDFITEIDLFKNTVETYKIKRFKTINKIIYHAKNSTVSYTFHSNEGLNVVNESYENFRGDLVTKELFYETTIEYTFLKISIAILTFFGVLWMVIVFLNKNKTIKRQIIYERKKDVFLYKKKKPINLNNVNFNVLKVFLKNQNNFFPINTLNDVLSPNIGEENYTTTNKRRARMIKDLSFELSNILNLDKDSIFITRSSDVDRRIKEIKLNIDIVSK